MGTCTEDSYDGQAHEERVVDQDECPPTLPTGQATLDLDGAADDIEF